MFTVQVAAVAAFVRSVRQFERIQMFKLSTDDVAPHFHVYNAYGYSERSQHITRSPCSKNLCESLAIIIAIGMCGSVGC